MPQRPPCKSLRELALDTLSAHAELIPTDAVDALDEATAADVVRVDHGETLTTPIAQRFMASRHVELSRALGELDLVAGVSTYGDGYLPSLVAGAGNVTIDCESSVRPPPPPHPPSWDGRARESGAGRLA